MELSSQKCEPCRVGTPPLSAEEAAELLKATPRWRLKENAVERDFVNAVAELAEAEDHHPDIHVSYSRVRLELTTHKIKGLSRNDFILAAKIDRLG